MRQLAIAIMFPTFSGYNESFLDSLVHSALFQLRWDRWAYDNKRREYDKRKTKRKVLNNR